MGTNDHLHTDSMVNVPRRKMGPDYYAPEFQAIGGVRVIGIGNKARHGKDTAAALLVREFGAVRYSFADDLYAVCRVLHGMRGKDAPLLQRVGLEFRDKDPDVWIRSVYSKLLAERPALAVISDCRFPNEFDFVRQLGGECWKVERRLQDGSLFVDPSRPADHPSETANDSMPWDRVLANREGEIDAFRLLVRLAACSFLEAAA